MAGLSLQHIFKKYDNGFEAVKDFNLEIEDKEFIIFVGPSGCGKSTTLRMIAGLEEITSGDLYIGDERVNDVEPKNRDIAMVFQSYALYPHMTVYDNMAFGLKLRKIPKDEIDKKVHEAAKILDIEHLLDRKPRALSGGQRQRVAMGRAIVRNPKIFLMDEPFQGLDYGIRMEMVAMLLAIWRREKPGVLFVTHEIDEALTIDYGRREAIVHGQVLALTRREYDILALLSLHPGQVYEREQMYEAIWGLDAQGDNAVIPEHIRNIRRKLAEAGVSDRIQTVWGVGYRWARA